MFLITFLCLFICRHQRTLWRLAPLWTIQQSAHPWTYSGQHLLYIYYSPHCRVNIPYKKRNVHFSFLFHLFSFCWSQVFSNHFHFKPLIHRNFKPIGTPFIWFRNIKWIKERYGKAVKEKVIAVGVFSLWLSCDVLVRNYLCIPFREKHAPSYTWK